MATTYEPLQSKTIIKNVFFHFIRKYRKNVAICSKSQFLKEKINKEKHIEY